MRDSIARAAVSALAVAGFGASALIAGTASAQTALNRAVQTQTQAERDARGAQRRIDQLDDETQKLVGEYRAAILEAESLRSYIKTLEAQVESQNEEVKTLEVDIQRIEDTNRGVLPLMERMVDGLEKLVELDVPFLPNERNARVDNLRTTMVRADVTTADKYRQIMEAYQTEMGYARNVDAYTGNLGDTGKEVDFLRVGRVALMYQTPGGGETGFWDNEAKEWVKAPDMKRAVQDGLRIAKKQAPPRMMLLKVHAPEEAQ